MWGEKSVSSDEDEYLQIEDTYIHSILRRQSLLTRRDSEDVVIIDIEKLARVPSSSSSVNVSNSQTVTGSSTSSSAGVDSMQSHQDIDVIVISDSEDEPMENIVTNQSASILHNSGVQRSTSPVSSVAVPGGPNEFDGTASVGTNQSQAGNQILLLDIQIERLLAVLRPSRKKVLIPTTSYDTLEQNLKAKRSSLAGEPIEVISKLGRLVADTVTKLQSLTEVDKIWEAIKSLVQKFDVEKLREHKEGEESKPEEHKTDQDQIAGEVTLEDREELKREKIKTLEKLIKEKFADRINELSTQDNDLSDIENENNTPFLKAGRLQKKFKKYYEQLCTLSGTSSLTGRPIHKKLAVTNDSIYPALEKKVFDLVNSKPRLCVPDAETIHELVEKENEKSGLKLNSKTNEEITEYLLGAVIDKMKPRQLLDYTYVKLAIPKLSGNSDFEDPADKDADLAKKLMNNKANWKSERDVFNKFVKRQNENLPGDNDVVLCTDDEEEGTGDDDDGDTESEEDDFQDLVDVEGGAGSEKVDNDFDDAEENVTGPASKKLKMDDGDGMKA